MQYHHDSPWMTLRSRPQTWKFCVKLLVKLISLYVLNMLMDQVDTLQVDRYWSKVYAVLILVFITHLYYLEVKVTDLEICVLVLVKLISLYVLNIYMYLYQVDTLHVYRKCLKFYAVPSQPT